jgi:hypothetical protein
MGVVLGAVINNRRLLGWLPIIANFEYTLAVFRFKDNEMALKCAFIVNSLMFIVFNFVISNYVGTVTNTVVTITTAVSLIRGHRNKNKESQEE